WKPRGTEVYRRLAVHAPTTASACVELAERWRTLVADLEGVRSEQRLRVLDLDIAQEEHDADVGEVMRYLVALHDALGRTASWHPPGDLGKLFAERWVKVVGGESRSEVAPGLLYEASRHLIRGDVTWREAIAPTRIAVVLADAGYGKTWLLKHHAR